MGLTLRVKTPIMLVPLRGRAVAARRAHNPEVSGSNPLPATQKARDDLSGFFVSKDL